MSAEAVGVGRDRTAYVVRGTHRTLVRSLSDTSVPTPRPEIPPDGLVVVPASRPAPLLTTPARVAADLGWPLLLVCSHASKAKILLRQLRDEWPGVQVVAADLLHRNLLQPPGEWVSDKHAAALARLDVDTNRKRNLGLAAARMTGKSWVLFVDDDVFGLSTSHVARAREHLVSTGGTIVSWALEWFPDNSVVHHARRDVLGLDQDVFLGGAALLVALDGWIPPGFPPIYNEDWLFLFDPIAEGRVAAGPDVGQLGFNPYEHPERARDEEFGDVLGEGLFHLLHEELPVEVALQADYWRSVHDKRTRLVHRIVAEVRRRLDGPGSATDQRRLVQALAALEESRKQLTRSTPASLADFVRRWRQDNELWQVFYERLPDRATLRGALVYLGLHNSWIVTS